MAQIYRPTNKFNNSRQPMIVNMTNILDNLCNLYGETYVKQRLKNAQMMCQSPKGYSIHVDPAHTEVTRHFNNWIIDYKEDFLDLCNIVVGSIHDIDEAI